MTTLPHGSTWRPQPEGPALLQDPHGTTLVELTTGDAGFKSARFLLPSGDSLSLERRGETHPLLGPVDSFCLEPGSATLALCQAINWRHPTLIPAVDAPGKLPGGAGSALLNFLAISARAAGQATLHYAGPYPTAALFDTIYQSFEVTGDPALAYETFTEGAETRPQNPTAQPVPVPFTPHPFEWCWTGEGLCAQLREGLEAVYIKGSGYHRHRSGSRRLRSEGANWAATVEPGGHPWTQRALFTPEGTLLGEVAPLPPHNPQFHGQPLPERLREVLQRSLVSRAPLLLREPLTLVLQHAPLTWGDTGEESAQSGEQGIVIHAVLKELLKNQPPATVLQTLSDVIEGPASQLAARVLEEAHSSK